jgi:hypothetical protein
MRVLVVGKAKTGTTALVSLVKGALDPCHLVMEPRSVLDFGPDSNAGTGNEAIKILYEHFRDRPRHLDAIVHAEFGFPVDKVVFISRDVRDEMVSKLLYHAKIARDDKLVTDPTVFAEWVGVLEQKEHDPAGITFHELCRRFHELFGIDLWARITDMDEKARYEHYITEGVERDRFVMPYEDMVVGNNAALADYLGVPLTSDMSSVDLGQYGHTIRSGKAGNWRSVFTPADVELLRPMLRDALPGPLYDDWELHPDTRLDPDEYSGYVRRISMR